MQELYKPLTEKLAAKKVAQEMEIRKAPSSTACKAINECTEPRDAAEKLLTILMNQDDKEAVFERFLDDLKSTNQSDIFLWIVHPGSSLAFSFLIVFELQTCFAKTL